MNKNADDDDLQDLRARSSSLTTEVVSSPAKMLDDIVSFVSHGKPIPQEQLKKLDNLLQTLQPRIDLAKIGINDYQLNHLTQLTKMLDTVSKTLFTEFDGQLVLTAALTPDEVVSLYKILLSEKNSVISHLTGKAQQQLVSSPDNMRQLPQDNSVTVPEQAMNADERQGVRKLLEAIMASKDKRKMVEATVVSESSE